MAKSNKKYRSDTLLKRFTKQKQRNVLAKPGPRELVIILDGLKPNYNIGKIFRSGDAFGVRKIHLVNIDVFDPAPAKGSLRSVPAVFDNSFANAHTALQDEGYKFFIFAPTADTSLQDISLPAKSAFIFGHEEGGLSFDPDEYAGMCRLTIPHFGPVQSLNVSVAASVVMYEYVRRHRAGV